MPSHPSQLTRHVSDAIRAGILSSRYHPGERLLQQDIADELGVSRQPVRNALVELVTLGLVTETRSGGFVVRKYNRAEVSENYHLRLILEPEAAALAALHAERNELDELVEANEAIRKFSQQGDGHNAIRANTALHQIVHRAAHLPKLNQILDQLWGGITVLTPLMSPHRMEQSVDEHARVIECIARQDADGAREAMWQHIDTARGTFNIRLAEE